MILKQFLLQAQKEDLKTSSYPKEWAGLKMKVSFGIGTPARVPWIAFIAPEMQVSRGFYPVYLYYKELETLILAYGVSETEEFPKSWPAEIMNSSPTISAFFNKDIPRYGSSFVFKAYKIGVDNEKVEFKYFDEKPATDKDLEADLTTILDYYKKIVPSETKNEVSHQDEDYSDREERAPASDKLKYKDPHHQKFVKKVANLFKKAGFKEEEVTVKGPTSRGADIEIKHTTEDGRKIKILVECKESEEFKEYAGLQNLIDSYSTKARREKADLALLILKGYSIPASYMESGEREKIRKKEKVVYWDNDAWKFYEETVRSMHKPYARYTILRDLGYKIRLQKDPYIIDAFEIKQSAKGNKIWVFAIEPEKLLKISYVFRRGSTDPEAYQRLLTRKRLKEIGEFLSEPSSLLVNNIIVAFESSVKYKDGKLRIPVISASAWIVDGQHRLYGFCNIRERTRAKKILSKYKLIVAGIKASRKEQAKLFKEINENQEKLDRSLLLDLYDYLEIDDEDMILRRVRVAKKLRKTDMFMGRIKILKKDKGKITLANIVDYDKYIDIVKTHREKAYGILNNFFKAFYKAFPQEWESDEYIFTTNKGIRMLISLCKRTLNYLDRTNKPMKFEEMKKIAETFKESLKDEEDLLKESFYVGKALGAGAPDIVSRDLWATRIHNILGNFLSRDELEKIGKEEREMLGKLENAFRECIKTKLGNIPNWWTQRIPSDTRLDAEERWQKGNRQGDVIEYLNWGDYEKIFLQRNNWNEIFQQVFGDKDIFVARLKELTQIRNDIAHNRKLSQEKRDKLKLYYDELVKNMSS